MKKYISVVFMIIFLCRICYGAEYVGTEATVSPSINEGYISYGNFTYYQNGEPALFPTSGDISARIGVVNSGSTPAVLKLAIAAYNPRNQLESVQITNITLPADTTKLCETGTITAGSEDLIRAFIWTDNLIPVIETGDVRTCSLKEAEIQKRISKNYADIDDAFLGTFNWLTDIYDPETGGFYTTVSGARYEGFVPSLESTAFVCQMLTENESGAITAMPEDIRQSLIEFFESRYNAKDGYYYDDGFSASDYTDRDKIRMYGQCVAALKLLNLSSAYSAEDETLMTLMSSESIEAYSDTSGIPDYCQSVESFMEKVTSQDWDNNSWEAGDNAYEWLSYTLALDNAKEYKSALISWLDQRQDDVTGYWAKSGDYGFNAVSGAFKVVNIYNRFNLCPPNPEKIINSVVQTLRSGESPTHACYVRNPISILGVIRQYRPELIESMKTELELEFTEYYKNKINALFQSDGGASSKPHRSCFKFGGIPAGLALCEGDADGMRQMWIARKDLNRVFDHTLNQDKLSALYSSFWNSIQSKAPIVKIPFVSNGSTVFENFDEISGMAELYEKMWSCDSDAVQLKTADGNQHLSVTDNSAIQREGAYLKFPAHTKSGIIECSVKWNRTGSYSKGINDVSYAYLSIGEKNNSLIEIHAIDSGTDTLTLKAVKESSGGNQYQTLTTVALNTWVDIKVCYVLENGVLSTEYYVDGNLISSANGIYTNKIADSVDSLSVLTSIGRNAEISMDNIKISSN